MCYECLTEWSWRERIFMSLFIIIYPVYKTVSDTGWFSENICWMNQQVNMCLWFACPLCPKFWTMCSQYFSISLCLFLFVSISKTWSRFSYDENILWWHVGLYSYCACSVTASTSQCPWKDWPSVLPHASFGGTIKVDEQSSWCLKVAVQLYSVGCKSWKQESPSSFNQNRS